MGSSCWVTMPCSATDSWTRTWCCWAGGNTSTMRSTVWAVSWVCRVAKTRWPVSAAVSAVEIVSRSRISPTRITSGSWRRAAFRRHGEGLRVGAHLALVDDAALVPVEELDRILDGHDVLVALLVDQVEHRGERGGLARAGRAGDQHEAAGLLGEVAQHGRQAERVQRRHLLGDQAEGGADRGALEVGVDAEAGLAGNRSRPGRSASRSPASGAGRWRGSSRRSRGPPGGRAPGASSARSWPRLRSMGGDPAVRCRSDAPVSRTSSRMSAKSISMVSPYRRVGAIT